MFCLFSLVLLALRIVCVGTGGFSEYIGVSINQISSWRTLFLSSTQFDVLLTHNTTHHAAHASGGGRGGALCRFRRRSLRPPLPVVLANVRSLRNKTGELFHLLTFKREFRDYFISCFTESWLDSQTRQCPPPGHARFRADRSSELTDKERVCFLVNQRW